MGADLEAEADTTMSTTTPKGRRAKREPNNPPGGPGDPGDSSDDDETDSEPDADKRYAQQKAGATKIAYLTIPNANQYEPWKPDHPTYDYGGTRSRKRPRERHATILLPFRRAR